MRRAVPRLTGGGPGARLGAWRCVGPASAVCRRRPVAVAVVGAGRRPLCAATEKESATLQRSASAQETITTIVGDEEMHPVFDFHPEEAAAMWERADSNGDGEISRPRMALLIKWSTRTPSLCVAARV